MNPIEPVMINAACQPHVTIIAGTARGAAIAPTFVPELKMLNAKALSFLGNHSAIALLAAGKLPDSPTPSNALQNPNPITPLARA